MNIWGIRVSVQIIKEGLGSKIEIMEKEIVYLKGRSRVKALKKYHKLIKPLLKESIFLTRSE